MLGCCSIVIWLGDMNYRIDLDNDTVRDLATTDQLDALLAADQVRPYRLFVLDEMERSHSFLIFE